MNRRWVFGSAMLDERTFELQVGGQAVELERKSLQVLLHLLNHAGELVTKDEMLAAVWPGRILSDSVITSCIARVRDVLKDETQAVVKTVHGFGYRLVAPVKVETLPSAERARFDFKPGEHLPARPLWSLVDRLGTGGHGEAWLARHDKTHEKRVYKFAADGDTLVALKREITIYRLLHDTLGDRPDIIRLLDWNLDEPPCFVEYDFVEGGSLAAWAQAQGGIDRVPLPVRIEIAAQVADALGAAHSVGVLHKDLKPANVLIERREGAMPQVKLCDFGSGGVLDVSKLEELGITRLGFTRTMGDFAKVAGTPLYLAPEVVAGQPCTVKSDTYALGVLLYQLAAGNFHKTIVAGWEHDVADELLREDIAAAADGHPELRLADAGRLARRLRALDERRRKREAERAALAAAESAKLEMERMRARRKWARLAIAALVVGVVASSALYVDARRARDAAADAAATSKAVTEFLSQDMFAQVGEGQRAIRDLTIKEVLDSASAQVAKRFQGRPATEADVHLALGASYEALDDERGMAHELEAGLRLLQSPDGNVSPTALQIAAKLVILDYALGRLRSTLAGHVAMLEAGRATLGARDPNALQLGQQIAYGEYLLGDWRSSADTFSRMLADAEGIDPPDEVFVGSTERMLGNALLQLGDFAGAEAVLKKSVARLIARLGEKHVRVAQSRTLLAEVYTETGRLDEAEAELDKAVGAASAWAPSLAAGYVARARVAQGRLRMEQGRYPEAERILGDSLAAYLAQKKPEERDQSGLQRRPLAEAFQREGRLADAEGQMRLALEGTEKYDGPDHPMTQRMRIGLADILRQRGKLPEAREQLARVNRAVLASLSDKHPMLGLLRRVDGLVLHAAGDDAAARTALQEALAIFESRYGAADWRTERARKELAGIPAARAPG